MKNYLIAYDIFCAKRAYQVRKLVYAYALSGQKSALEVLLNKKELKELLLLLTPLLDEADSVNVIELDEKAMLFGKANQLIYDKGVVII